MNRLIVIYDESKVNDFVEYLKKLDGVLKVKWHVSDGVGYFDVIFFKNADDDILDAIRKANSINLRYDLANRKKVVIGIIMMIVLLILLILIV